ncbi:class I SAM-dependent methyltransferase [Chryseolinea sp. H1M3-3]|uniref:class I SAM-dependent methyltransferase n=1 Tax=Chryseolinea sp. H1M3-3 TaxID=3034144 RepID=UPI0023ED973A|nr:class I SAM-dependent methyltransferase [Chryseolinea sp. H1M3-3]
MGNLQTAGKCRFCQTPLQHTFVDLGMSPLCQDHVKPEELNRMEAFYPLHAYVCENCFLVQLEEFVAPSAIFNDYAYFSSYSDSWLQHAKRYTEQVVGKFQINQQSLVAEIASNDGYLLQYFVEKGIPVLGIEPAANVAEYAITKKGIRTETKFFGCSTATTLFEKYGNADLLIGNNVLAHVPDINDFVSGMKIFLNSKGLITMEFPHLLRLVERNQFDTIYHEHFSYLSFMSVDRIFQYHGLQIFDVEELPTHGGSLRIYAKHIEDDSKLISFRVKELLKREDEAGLSNLSYYKAFEEKVRSTKRKILDFLIRAKNDGKKIAGYGAPGKGNTLLNYCGIRTDFIDYTVDRNPHKQGNFLPGTLIPIYEPNKIRETKPDYVFILPWNLKEEIMDSMSFIQEWGGKFVVPIPEIKVYDPLWLIHRFKKAS